jgi:hypothetical protein
VRNFADVIKQDIDRAISNYDKEPEISKTPIKLKSVEKNVLASRILCLPEKYKTILFLKYFFHLEEGSISKMVNQDYIPGCLRYANELLCFAMGLPSDSTIHEDTMEKACRIAIHRYCSDFNVNSDHQIHKYSNKFKRNLRLPPSHRNLGNLIVLIGKRVAMLALAVLITFATSIAVNAELREQFFQWVRNTFPQFTEFGAPPSSMPDDSSIKIPADIEPDYIPDGFTLSTPPYVSPTSKVYTYYNDVGEALVFTCRVSTGSLVAYDTEGAEVVEFEYKGFQAFIWENKGLTYLIWQQDGYECSVSGKITKDEAFFVANSVNYSK